MRNEDPSMDGLREKRLKGGASWRFEEDLRENEFFFFSSARSREFWRSREDGPS